MRALALTALVLIVAGCGATEATAPPTAAIPTPSIEDTGLPEHLVDPATLTAKEKAYMEAAFGTTDRDGVIEYSASVLKEGRRLCGPLFDVESTSGPPTAEWIAENGKSDDAPLEAAIKHLCPQYLDDLRQARADVRKAEEAARETASAIEDGVYTVGEDLKPGTYRTTGGRIVDCYWERSTPHGQIIANDFVSNAPKGVRVTLRSGEGFKSEGCGTWVPA